MHIARTDDSCAESGTGNDSAPGPGNVADSALAWTHRLAASLTASIECSVVGKPAAVRTALVALLAGGHLLVEDVPGVGKTLLAKSIARAVGGDFNRIQATPDLLPADLTGVSVYHRSTETWEFRPGPLFADVVLVDELNRATPRTQSALLEAMEERQITVEGATRPLSAGFFLVATQNPAEHAGTFPLVEGQRDRFCVTVRMGYPDRDTERALLLGAGGTAHLGDVTPVCDPAGLAAAQTAVRSVHLHPSVADYVLEICDRTRHHRDVSLGASPRGALALVHAAQAEATIAGRDFVDPADVKAVAVAVLAHRILLTGGPDLDAAGALVHGILADVTVPRA